MALREFHLYYEIWLIANLCCSAPESHLRALFNQYGVVQTCIVNVDKRHAFIKMINRRDAMNAREGMETYKSGDMQLRVSCLQVFVML